jgi:Icc-related predicted phosphoesterase
MADTHKRHKEVLVPQGDILISAGDVCGGGSEKSARKFARWFAEHSHPHKVMVAGNHDRCFDNGARGMMREYVKSLGIIYLEHEPAEIAGLKFFGSPYQPEFCSWAFNLPRGEALHRKWVQIPDDTEVLITHCPPRLILDLNDRNENCGCQELLRRVMDLKHLKLHVFGHIHFSYGEEEHAHTRFINAAVCGENYEPDNAPIVVDL